jgi:hypothetical protein
MVHPVAPEVGTLAWGRRTGGVLSRRDRLEMLRCGIRLKLADAGDALRSAIGRGGAARVELPDRAPDSALARDAEELCREAMSPALVEHSMRVWMWGSLLGRRDGVGYDDELLYVASLLHDLKLPDPAAVEAEGVRCFALAGGIAAERFARERGYEPERANELGETVAMHVNGWVPPTAGPERHLVAAGAALDVVGAHRRRLDRETVAAVLERHPRRGAKRELTELCRAMAAATPGSRVDFAIRRLFFLRLIRAAPFRE